MKFKFFQQVRIKDGFFKDCVGRVIDCYENQDDGQPIKYSYSIEIKGYRDDAEGGYVSLAKEKEAFCKEESLE